MGIALKANPFGGASHAKEIVLEKVGVEAKEPDSALGSVSGFSNQKWPKKKKNHNLCTNDGCLNFIEENDEVLVAGFGCKGHAVGDIPGVQFQVVKVASVSLWSYTKARRKGQNHKFNGEHDSNIFSYASPKC